MVEFDPLNVTRVICAVAVAVQTTELLVLRRFYDDNGVWRWEILKRDFRHFPAALLGVISPLMEYRSFLFLLSLRLVAAAGTLFVSNFYLLALMLLSNILISMRWRGAFNGGSDAMTTVVLSALTLSALIPDNPKVQLGCIYYIALQSCLSYVISGIAKLCSPNWRSGAALYAFLTSGSYAIPDYLLALVRRRTPAALLGLSLIGFECLFPIALLNPDLCIAVLLCGAGFHLANAYFLGLNRFLFIWIATYPTLLWCSL